MPCRPAAPPGAWRWRSGSGAGLAAIFHAPLESRLAYILEELSKRAPTSRIISRPPPLPTFATVAWTRACWAVPEAAPHGWEASWVR